MTIIIILKQKPVTQASPYSILPQVPSLWSIHITMNGLMTKTQIIKTKIIKQCRNVVIIHPSHIDLYRIFHKNPYHHHSTYIDTSAYIYQITSQYQYVQLPWGRDKRGLARIFCMAPTSQRGVQHRRRELPHAQPPGSLRSDQKGGALTTHEVVSAASHCSTQVGNFVDREWGISGIVVVGQGHGGLDHFGREAREDKAELRRVVFDNWCRR